MSLTSQGAEIGRRIEEIDARIAEDHAAGYDTDALLDERIEQERWMSCLMAALLARS